MRSSPAYDNNGNTTRDDGGVTYTYDAWNRVMTDSVTETFRYLPGGQRASMVKCAGTPTYSYFSADWRNLEDDVPTGCPGAYNRSTFVWSIGYIDDLVARDDPSGNRLYAQQDANHNVTALIGKVGSNWQVVERFVYDPYGVASVLTSAWASTTDTYTWVYRFQGGRYDGNTGLYNFRHRDLSPTLGRWTQEDTVYRDGPNLYLAYRSGPVEGVDPTGQGWLSGLTGALGGALGAVGAALAVGALATALAATAPITLPVLGIAAIGGLVAGGLAGGISTNDPLTGFQTGFKVGTVVGTVVAGARALPGGASPPTLPPAPPIDPGAACDDFSNLLDGMTPLPPDENPPGWPPYYGDYPWN